jgi:hypothetical protein
MIHWSKIQPKDAMDIVLPRQGIQGPVDTEGLECPWPWEPQQLKDVPLGMYHCPYCGDMVVAGMSHVDYATERWDTATAQWVNLVEEAEREVPQ